jgi:hypothetical protein
MGGIYILNIVISICSVLLTINLYLLQRINKHIDKLFEKTEKLDKRVTIIEIKMEEN